MTRVAYFVAVAVAAPVWIGGVSPFAQQQEFAATRASSAAGESAPAPQSAPAVSAARPWWFDGTDLPLHPDYHFGQLANGVRTAWAHRPVPPGRVHLRLWIGVGSFVEEDDESGMAHFLEHVCVDGSRKGPERAYLSELEAHGLSFTGHRNAFTDRRSTIYMLDLPAADAASVRQGLRALRSMAAFPDLDAAGLTAVGELIDAEERLRAQSDNGMERARIEHELAGARVATRDPMGKAAARASFTTERLRAFHARWYRPEHFTVISAGDLAALEPADAIAEVFGDLTAPEPRVPLPDMGLPDLERGAWCARVEASSNHWLFLERVRPARREVPTSARMIEQAPALAARLLLADRFEALARGRRKVVHSALVEDAGTGHGILRGERIGLTAAPGRWREALALGAEELRRGLEFGFEDVEVERHRRAVLESFDRMVARESQRSGAEVASDLVLVAEGRLVPIAPADLRELMAPVMSALDAQRCSEALRQDWTTGHERIGIVGPRFTSGACEDVLRAALEASRAQPLESRPSAPTRAFAHASAPLEVAELAKLSALTIDERSEVRELRLAPGVRARWRAVDGSKGAVHLLLRVAGGRAAARPDQGAVAWVAPQFLLAGGFDGHDEAELAQLFAERRLGLTPRVEDEWFGLEGRVDTPNLLFALEVLCASLERTGWRANAWQRFHDELHTYYANRAASADWPLRSEWRARLRGGDARFGVPPVADTLRVSAQEVRDWISPLLASAPLDLTLCGDLDDAAVREQLARTFGRLAARESEPARPAPPPYTGGLVQHYTHAAAPGAAAISIVWPLPMHAGADRVVLSALAMILQERMNTLLREKLRSSYAPRVHFESGTGERARASLWLDADVEAARAEEVREACVAAAAELAASGPNGAELELARARALPEARAARDSERGWFEALMRSMDDDAELGRHLDRVTRWEALELGELVVHARMLFEAPNASSAIAMPRSSTK